MFPSVLFGCCGNITWDELESNGRLWQSNLEFELRLQQYIEMVRAGDKTEARQHARRFLSPHSETQATDIRRAAGLLVFSPDTEAAPYKVSLRQIIA